MDKIGDIDSATKFPESDVNVNTLYKGSNKANVAKYITVNDGQLNVTADTTVLLVNSDADNNNEIGLKYTYGDKLPKASEYVSNGNDAYLINAMWVMDEAGTDDADIEVLVIDATGAFKGYKMDDVNAPSVSVATFGTPVYGTASDVTITPTYKNFTAVKTEITAPDVLTVGTGKVSTSATTDAGTYTVTVKGTDKDGKTVSTTAKVVVAKKSVTPAPLTAPAAPTAGSRFNTFKPTFTSGAGYTLGTPVVTIDGTDIATAPLSTFAKGDTLTITVPVTADKNYTVTVDKLTTTVKVQ